MKSNSATALTATRIQLATILEVNVRTIDKFVDDGMPVLKRGSGGRPSIYGVQPCVQWFVDRQRAALTGEGLSPQQERALLDRVRREELELRLKVKRGELVAIAEVAQDFSECAAAVKARIRRIPDAMAERLAAAGTPAAIKGLLLTAIDEALRELTDRGGQLGVEVPVA
jgi:phage terminase Nu1 subunit (DNA packaging protein)